jgi:pimeloyl-ACP methyl ester carboxylesterase
MASQCTITVADHRLGVTIGNEQCRGPAVVFLHGILGSEHFWPLLVPEEMRQRVRWYAVSLPGHFPSRFPPQVRDADLTADRLTEVLGELINRLVGATPVSLVGWSTGACLALQLAARQLCLVRSVFSIAGFAHGRWHGVLGRLQKLAGGGPLARRVFRQALKMMTAGDRRHRWAYGLVAAQPGSLWTSAAARTVLRAVRQDAVHQDLEALRRLFACIRGWDVADRLQAIRVPVIVAGGDRDPIIPYRHTCELTRIIPTARLVSFAGMGHTFFGEHLRDFQACLQVWLEELVLPQAA